MADAADDLFDKYKTTPAPSPAAADDADSLFDKYKAEAPQAPAPTASGADPELVRNIMTTANVDEGEATRRALNTAALMKASAPVLKGGGSGEYGDIGSQLGTLAEKAFEGITPLGIGRTIEGGVGRVFEAFGMEDNPLTPENIESRAIENPSIALTGEIGGAVAQGGLSLLKSAAPSLFAKLADVPGLGQVARVITEADILSRGASQASSRAGARALAKVESRKPRLEELLLKETLTAAEEKEYQTLATAASKPYSSYVEAARQELPRLEELAAEETRLGQSLMNVGERKLLETLRSASKPSVIEKVVSAIPKTPKATRLAAERAANERAKFVISQNLKEQYTNLGFSDKLALRIVDTAIGGAAGALSAATQTLMDLPALSKEEIDATGEHLGASLLVGAGVGAGLAGLVPAAADGISLGIKGVRKGLNLIADKLVSPIAGLTFKLSSGELGAETKVIRVGLKLADIMADGNYKDTLRNFRGSAQYQYDNLKSYLDSAERSIELMSMPTDVDEANAVRESMSAWKGNIKDILGKIQKNYMHKTDSGKWIYNRKLDDSIMAMKPIVTKRPDGSYAVDLTLPEHLESLERELSRFQQAYLAGMTEPQREIARPMMSRTPMSPDNMERLLPQTPNRTTPFYRYIDEDIPELYNSERFMPPTGRAPFAGIYQDITLPREVLTQPLKISALDEMIGRRLNPIQPEKTLASYGGAAGVGAAAEALGAPFGIQGSLLTKFGYDLFFNQTAAIDNYATLQKLSGELQKRSLQFASALTRNKSISTAATKSLLENPLRRTISGKIVREGAPPNLTNEEARSLYESDKELLTKLSGEDAYDKFINQYGNDYDKLDAAYPVISQNVSLLLPRQVSFLKSKMEEIFKPQNTGINRYAALEPTSQQIYSYGLYSRYVRDPDAIYTDIVQKKYVPQQALDVLNAVYPATYRRLKGQILDELIKSREAGEFINPQQQMILDKLLGNRTGGFNADQVKALQQTFQTAPTPQGGGPVSNQRLELEKTGTTSE